MANKRNVHGPDSFAPWQSFVKQQISRALHEGDLTSFVGGLRREAWLLSDEQVEFQVWLIGAAGLKHLWGFITSLFYFDPPPLPRRLPPSQALLFPFPYFD